MQHLGTVLPDYGRQAYIFTSKRVNTLAAYSADIGNRVIETCTKIAVNIENIEHLNHIQPISLKLHIKPALILGSHDH